MKITYKNIVGKTILMGLTYLDENEEVLKQVQFYGTVTSADENQGIAILKANNKDFFLPPDINSIVAAPAGEYKLRSTGEIIVDPDLLTTWTVTPPNSEESYENL
jgi:hypothetical protein